MTLDKAIKGRLTAVPQTLETRMIAAVARRLGCRDVELVGHARSRGGWPVPVFRVPASVEDAAIAAGLTVETAHGLRSAEPGTRW